MSLNIGIVGTGHIGNVHAKVYKDNPKTKVVAVCDFVKEKADAAAVKHEAQAFYSIKDMLSSGIKLDACSICTAGVENGGNHFAPTMELLEAGIPVLGEKPISNNIEEGKKMVELAKKKQIPYGINLNHRFTPAARKAKEWVKDGRLGKLHMMNMRLWVNNPRGATLWFHMRALHPHSFDVMRYFCGDIKKVSAFVSKGEGKDIWSNCQVILLFENGVIGNLTGSYDAGPGYGYEHYEVVGSKGRFVIEDTCEHLHFNNRFSIEGESYHYLGGMKSFNDTFKDRIDKWIDQVESEDKYDEIEASGEDALKAQVTIEAAIKSWETSSAVSTSTLMQGD